MVLNVCWVGSQSLWKGTVGVQASFDACHFKQDLGLSYDEP